MNWGCEGKVKADSTAGCFSIILSRSVSIGGDYPESKNAITQRADLCDLPIVPTSLDAKNYCLLVIPVYDDAAYECCWFLS
jgi:hypothetical protein